MVFFRYPVLKFEKMFQKSARLTTFMQSWAKWYLIIKFNRRTNQTPQLVSWSRRSLYTSHLHYNNKKDVKKSVMLHLFWVLDLWQLNQPMLLKGVSSTYPFRLETTNINSLEVHGLFQNWLGYSINNDHVFSYKVTSRWLQYKPNLWMTRTYQYFAKWYPRSKKQREAYQKEPTLWFIYRWYLANQQYHKLQYRFRCQVPVELPNHYTRTLWLRLMQYPCVYNLQWFTVLRDLSQFTNRAVLPWPLLYTNKRAWTFDQQACGLARLVKGLVSQRMQITEYILVKRWKDLLVQDDVFSRSFQIFIRNSIFFRQFMNVKREYDNGLVALEIDAINDNDLGSSS